VRVCIDGFATISVDIKKFSKAFFNADVLQRISIRYHAEMRVAHATVSKESVGEQNVVNI